MSVYLKALLPHAGAEHRDSPRAIDYKTFACLPATIAPYVWKYLRYFIYGYLFR